MEQLLQHQEEKAESIEQLIVNYKKDGAARKTKRYLESKISNLKKLYNEYVDVDNNIRQFEPHLEATHQYYKDRQVVLERFTKYIEDMRHRLNGSSLPSTPAATSDELRTMQKFNFDTTEEASNNIGDQEATGSKHTQSQQQVTEGSKAELNSEFDLTQLPKFKQHLKQQDIRMRGLYREIRLAEDILASNKRSRPALRLKIKNMERMMMQIMDLHEKICMETSEEQEANLKYFVDQHYENLYNEYDRVVILTTTILEEEEVSKPKPMEIRLPPVEIPHFHGDYMKWVGFADTFKRLVHDNNQLTNTHKMNYLKSHVEGSAGKLLSHLEPTGDNYDAAWKILENRFNNKRLLVSNLLNTLLNQQTSNIRNLQQQSRAYMTQQPNAYTP